MYAVIETGGKQFHVEPGQTIHVDTLPFEVGDEVMFDKVLMVGDEGSVTVGKPLVEGARVVAKVTEQGRGRKVIAFKYHNKERLRHKRGHRQGYTRLLISSIQA
jgi:large subunit ribosomal protein L21